MAWSVQTTPVGQFEKKPKLWRPQNPNPGGWPQAPAARSYTSPGQSLGADRAPAQGLSPAYSYPRVASTTPPGFPFLHHFCYKYNDTSGPGELRLWAASLLWLAVIR